MYMSLHFVHWSSHGQSPRLKLTRLTRVMVKYRWMQWRPGPIRKIQ